MAVNRTFFHGTETEVADYVNGKVDPCGDIPPVFIDDYRASGFAAVFPDCSDWKSKFSSYIKGSPQAVEAAIAMPMFDKLKHIGMFVLSNDDARCLIRIVYEDQESANNAHQVLDGLLAMAKMATAHDNESKADGSSDEMDLSSLTIEQTDSELRIPIESFVKLCADAMQSEYTTKVPGWFCMMTKLEAKEPGSARFKGISIGSSPTFVVQSIRPDNYRSKRVRFEAEVACNDAAAPFVGLFVWTSDQQNRSLSFQSCNVDGSGTIRVATNGNPKSVQEDDNATWRTVTVETNIPLDSETISFGCYAKQAVLGLKNVRLTAIGDVDHTANEEEPLLPVNLFAFPGQTLNISPTNLDFGDSPSESKTSEPQVADRDPNSRR